MDSNPGFTLASREMFDRLHNLSDIKFLENKGIKGSNNNNSNNNDNNKSLLSLKGC